MFVSYCVDSENKQISGTSNADGASSSYASNNHQYTLADVPRLAEYSASVYASTTAEHDHYFKYYTDYYIAQITKGHYNNLPTMSQIGETANSGAAVALSAIQRKQKQYKAAAAAVPSGTDNKKYRKFIEIILSCCFINLFVY